MKAGEPERAAADELFQGVYCTSIRPSGFEVSVHRLVALAETIEAFVPRRLSVTACPRIELATVLAAVYELATAPPRNPTIPMTLPLVMEMLVVMNVLPGWLAKRPRETWVVLGVAMSGTAPGKRTTSTVCRSVEVPASMGMRRPTMVKFTGAVK